MNASGIPTDFAPAERASAPALSRQIGAFAKPGLWRNMLDAIPDGVVILNKERQIIYANSAMGRLTGSGDGGKLMGLRPGEAVGCVHARETPGGCGTTMFCSTCHAVGAILASQQGHKAVEDCRITITGGAMDLRVNATPLKVEGDEYTIFAIMDVSNEKRRRMLERIFFHDILNLVVGLRGFAELSRQSDGSQIPEYQALISRLATQLIEEINGQRDLASAENNELTIRPVKIMTKDLLNEVADIYRNHPVAVNRKVIVADNAAGMSMTSDPVILRRILGNMVKNALEASAEGGTVTIGCDSDALTVRFWVNNAGVMPPEVQLQVFQRSFSTKGSNRGLGAYSIKLLTEKYLHGKATFTSTGQTGTTFMVAYPLALPAI